MRKFNGILAAMCAAPVLFFISAAAKTPDDLTISAEQIAQAREASTKTRGATTWWRHDEAGLLLGYDERWKAVNASQANSAIVLNWRSAKGDGLMATCYLELSEKGQNALANLRPDEIHANAESIAATLLANGRKRDPNSTLISSKRVIQDNHQAVYAVRNISLETIRNKSELKMYSLMTAWKGREVNLECASDIPVKFPTLAFSVEEPITRLMASLQFVR